MNALLRIGAIALSLTGAAAAQIAPAPEMPATGGVGAISRPEAVQLTPDQKATILEAVKRDSRKIAPPPGVTASVGSELPPSLELHMLPDSALAQVPAAKPYRYTMVENQYVLVDPTTMRVVEVLSEGRR